VFCVLSKNLQEIPENNSDSPNSSCVLGLYTVYFEAPAPLLLLHLHLWFSKSYATMSYGVFCVLSKSIAAD
jgi:hypothetical protein